MVVLGVVHQVAAHLVVLVAEALVTQAARGEQQPRVLDPAAADHEGARLEPQLARVAGAQARGPHAPRRGVALELDHAGVQVQIDVAVLVHVPQQLAEALGLVAGQEDLLLELLEVGHRAASVAQGAETVASEVRQGREAVALGRAFPGRVQVGALHRPAVVVDPVATTQVDRVERSGQSGPGGRRAAEDALAAVLLDRQADALDLLERVGRGAAPLAPALEHAHPQPRVGQLGRHHAARRTAAHDAHVVGRQLSQLGGGEVDDHGWRARPYPGIPRRSTPTLGKQSPSASSGD